MTTKRRVSGKRMGAAMQARIPEELNSDVERYAEQHELSFSAAVRELLSAGLVYAPRRPVFISGDTIEYARTGGAAIVAFVPETEDELETVIAAMGLDADERDRAREAWATTGATFQLTSEQAESVPRR